MTATPFFPPAVFGHDIDAALRIMWELGTGVAQQFTLGSAVSELEAAIRGGTGARHAVACGSGSAALTLALAALGIGRGDEVIVPAFGCQPVAGAVVNAGAVPVFADVGERTWVIDPAAVAAAVTPRTVAVLPVHVFSVMADMPCLTALARRHGLKVVEDAAVAAGAVLGTVPAGCLGDAGVFSFSPFKPFGTCGEGGIVLTGDAEVARRCRLLRDHGGAGSSGAELIGFSSRMDELPARFLLHRRATFAERLERKKEIAEFYTHALAPLAGAGLLSLPPEGAEGRWCHVYAVATDRRGELREHLASRGVDTHVYYPVPLPSQPAFARFARGMRFPGAETAGRANLALPAHPGLTGRDVAYTADAIHEFFRTGRSRKHG